VGGRKPTAPPDQGFNGAARTIEGGEAKSDDLLFCDFPTIPRGAMGKMMLTNMAAMAEFEAGIIGERTKAALQAAKARGVALGGHRDNAHRLTIADRLDDRSATKTATEKKRLTATRHCSRKFPSYFEL